MSDVEPTMTESSARGANAPAASAVPAQEAPGRGGRSGGRGAGRGNGPKRERRGGREERERARSEFDSKTLSVRRVARVVAGGRRFSFSVLLVIGNRKGSVGVGLGKAGDTALAIEKATKNAKKSLMQVPRTKNNSIPRQTEAKFSSAIVVMRPAPSKGLIAGSAVRSVLELAGVTDVNAKILSGSKNKLNIARAAIAALSKFAQVKSEARNPTGKL